MLNILPEINRRLEDPRLTGTLEEASEDTVDAIADLYGILDDHPQHQVQLVKLSKVLHRKRPELLPLYDKNVWRCYSQFGNPVHVKPVRRRSDRKRMQVWLPHVQADLKGASMLWRELAGLASEPTITPLRALDILAWRLVDDVTPRQKRRRGSSEKEI